MELPVPTLSTTCWIPRSPSSSLLFAGQLTRLAYVPTTSVAVIYLFFLLKDDKCCLFPAIMLLDSPEGAHLSDRVPLRLLLSGDIVSHSEFGSATFIGAHRINSSRISLVLLPHKELDTYQYTEIKPFIHKELPKDSPAQVKQLAQKVLYYYTIFLFSPLGASFI